MAKFLTTSQVAEMYGYTNQAIRNWVKDRKLKPANTVSKHLRFNPAELRQFELSKEI